MSGTSEKRFLLTKGEAPDFGALVKPILENFLLKMKNHGGNTEK